MLEQGDRRIMFTLKELETLTDNQIITRLINNRLGKIHPYGMERIRLSMIVASLGKNTDTLKQYVDYIKPSKKITKEDLQTMIYLQAVVLGGVAYKKGLEKIPARDKDLLQLLKDNHVQVGDGLEILKGWVKGYENAVRKSESCPNCGSKTWHKTKKGTMKCKNKSCRKEMECE